MNNLQTLYLIELLDQNAIAASIKGTKRHFVAALDSHCDLSLLCASHSP